MSIIDRLKRAAMLTFGHVFPYEETLELKELKAEVQVSMIPATQRLRDQLKALEVDLTRYAKHENGIHRS